MAFKLKTGKTINKILAGAGIAALGTVALGAISPNLASGIMGKIIPAAAAFGIGGIESVAGAVATSFIAGSDQSFTGANAMGNVQEDSL